MLRLVRGPTDLSDPLEEGDGGSTLSAAANVNQAAELEDVEGGTVVAVRPEPLEDADGGGNTATISRDSVTSHTVVQVLES